MTEPLRLLDLFSGIGGFSYAAERLVGGFTTVQFVEKEPFCQKVLRKHWPDTPIHDDITTFSPAPFSADVVCGGFPCQDISTAGKGAGIAEGTRSGLFFELMRVVREVRPRFVVLENVSAIRNNGLGICLARLHEAGFDAEWACIRASDVGACHQRDRWWCVACVRDGAEGSAGPELLAAMLECRNVADTNDTGSQGRRLARRAGVNTNKRDAWPRNPPGGRLNPDWRTYVSEPVLRRGDAGLSGRVDRLRALGNTVVPQVAAIPLARVKALADAQ